MSLCQDTQQANLHGLRERCRFTSAPQKTTGKLFIMCRVLWTLLSGWCIGFADVSLHQSTRALFYFLVIHRQLLCSPVDLVKRLKREYFGTLSSLITLWAFSNCCVIFSLHSAALLSCIAITGLFTRRLTSVFKWRSGPEGVWCSPGV